MTYSGAMDSTTGGGHNNCASSMLGNKHEEYLRPTADRGHDGILSLPEDRNREFVRPTADRGQDRYGECLRPTADGGYRNDIPYSSLDVSNYPTLMSDQNFTRGNYSPAGLVQSDGCTDYFRPQPDAAPGGFNGPSTQGTAEIPYSALLNNFMDVDSIGLSHSDGHQSNDYPPCITAWQESSFHASAQGAIIEPLHDSLRKHEAAEYTLWAMGQIDALQGYPRPQPDASIGGADVGYSTKAATSSSYDISKNKPGAYSSGRLNGSDPSGYIPLNPYTVPGDFGPNGTAQAAETECLWNSSINYSNKFSDVSQIKTIHTLTPFINASALIMSRPGEPFSRSSARSSAHDLTPVSIVSGTLAIQSPNAAGPATTVSGTSHGGSQNPVVSGSSRHRQNHPENGIYRCDKCPKGYGHKESLTRHQKEHNGNDSEKFWCWICGHDFEFRKDNLTRHLKDQHGMEKGDIEAGLNSLLLRCGATRRGGRKLKQRRQRR
ncbi:hypothetical protein VTJ83DRAFT_7052 [Remersonia thermophila]|uniref:C2H2-type domain-containing protein n=1 Tax=Remersonia thermophila TaxID=72144 RepID=A0ABR4D4Q9_9PEZI